MNQQVRIAPPPHEEQFGFSSADFARMLELGAFADMRVELVGGRLEKMAPAYGGHSQQNFNLAVLLAQAYAGQNVAIGTDLAVRIAEGTTRGVDIAVGRSDFPRDRASTGQDILLAVEIADTTLSRDLGGKATDYASIGIAHYWVVDLAGRVVHAMREPGEGRYTVREMVRFSEALPVPGTDRTITID